MDNDSSTTDGNSHGDNFTIFPNSKKQSLKQKLRLAGWRETTAFIEPDDSAEGVSEKQSPAAKRKPEQRERDLIVGWRQHNVKAPDDSDARELLSHIAQVIKSKKIRKIIRAALADPELIVIGRRVRRLRGEAGDQVRKLLCL